MKTKKLASRLSLFSAALLQLAIAVPAHADLAWSALNNGFSGVGPITIVTSPGHANEAFIGTELGGLFKTSDDGATWHETGNHIFAGNNVYQLEFNANNADEIYAATELGLFKTSDDGETWTAINNAPFSGSSVYCLAINPSNASEILVASGKGMFKSNDSGATWQPCTKLEGVSAYSLAFDPTNPKVVLMGTFHGLKRSTDGGITWGPFPTLLDGYPIFKLKVIGNKIYAMGISALHVSDNGGYKWVGITPPKSDPKADSPDITGFAADAQSNLYLAMYPVGVMKSTDGGKSWSVIKKSKKYFGLLAVNPQNSQELYGYREGKGVVQSQDAGKSWNDKNRGLNSAYINTVVADPNTTNKLYALTSAGYYAMHDGVNWEKGDGAFKNAFLSSIVVDASNSSHLVLGVNYDPAHKLSPLYQSNDSGNTWQKANVASIGDWKPSQVSTIAVNPANPKQMLACTGIMYQTQDGGANWTPTAQDQCDTISMGYNPANPNEVLGSEYDFDDGVGLMLDSKDSGKTWTVLSQIPYSAALSFAFDPTNPNVIYAGLAGRNNIMKSIDGGKTWANISAPLFHYEAVTGIIVDPANPQIVYASSGDYDSLFAEIESNKGVYVSTDAGAHWAPMNSGLYNTIVYSLSMSNGKLFAGTLGSGVFSTDMLANNLKKTK